MIERVGYEIATGTKAAGTATSIPNKQMARARRRDSRDVAGSPESEHRRNI